jgi:hypothetical protein
MCSVADTYKVQAKGHGADCAVTANVMSALSHALRSKHITAARIARCGGNTLW